MNPRKFDGATDGEFNPRSLSRWIGAAILVFVVILLAASGTYVVQPGTRGVAVTLGNVDPVFKREGFGFKQPFVTTIRALSIRQQTRPMPAECYSSDLQQVKMEVHVLYRVPEHSVVKIFQDFAGEPFDTLIAPRVQEALKEVAATQSAEQIVKNREEVKTKALELARRKIGPNFLEVVDLVIYHLALSPELGAAIEMKMVQEQEAAIIRAKGEAEAIQVRGTALRANPDFIKLQILQNWNGHSPLVVGAGGSGASLLLSLEELSKRDAATATRPVRATPPASGATTRPR